MYDKTKLMLKNISAHEYNIVNIVKRLYYLFK